jgi:type VI protein secretion system component VasK
MCRYGFRDQMSYIDVDTKFITERNVRISIHANRSKLVQLLLQRRSETGAPVNGVIVLSGILKILYVPLICSSFIRR